VKQVNVHYAKTNLSRLLEAVDGGEEIVISRAGKPVAKLVPFVAPARRLGLDKGLVSIAADFDAPLPPDVLSDFEA
jgi:prevent-host-death family protein